MIRLIVRNLRQRGIYLLRRGLPWGTVLNRDLNLMGFPSAPMLFDVGANVGQTLKQFKQAWPSSTLHCFEPTPEVFAELKGVAQHFGGVRCHNVALSATAGIAMLERGDISVLNQIRPASAEAAADAVPGIAMHRLDAFCRDRRIDRIDLLKIDTEGHDLEVIKGASDMLAAGAIDYVLTEVGFGEGVRFCLDTDVRGYLAQFGYRVLGVYEQSPSIYHSGWPHVGLYFANMLFARPGLAKPPR